MNQSQIQTNNSLYVRARELAQRIGVSERLIRKWQYQDAIPYRTMGRVVLFRVSEVEAALDSQMRGPQPVNTIPKTGLAQGFQALKEEAKASRHAKRNGTKVTMPVVTATTTAITTAPAKTKVAVDITSSQPVPEAQRLERERA